MKKLLLLLALLPLIADAQNSYKFFIFFKDKNNSPYSLNNPAAFLSQRALDRRTRQQISLDSLDLPVNPQYVNAISSLGVPVFARSKWFNGVVAYCDSTVLNQILNLPFVQSAKKVTRLANGTISKLETPDHHARISFPSNASSSVIDYGLAANQIQMINGDYLHNAGFTGSGMIIAMLDAGFYGADQAPQFQDLFSRNGVMGTWDFVDNQSSVYEDDSHGEACLSTIASFSPSQMVGTAPDASFYLLRTEDANTEFIIEEYNWAAGAEYADSTGADLISSSLGYTTFEDSLQNHTYADMDGNTCPASVAANIAARKGILPVISAGNLGQSSWHYISAPGDADSALTAGAVDATGTFAAFSSFGPTSDGDVKPSVVTQGQATIIADPTGQFFPASGTSFSCPLLAGATACLWQMYPDRTNMEIKSAVEQSAHLYTTPNDSMGYGIPNFRTASFILSTTDPNRTKEMLVNTFPNPFSQQLQISIFSDKNISASIELYDLPGKLLTSTTASLIPKTITTISITDLQNVAQGLYILKVKTATSEQSVRIIKQ